MSLPTADLPAPLAVLVLAWEEAAPAVRALVEATQASAPTVDSILVMVPQADVPDHLSAEEYLPLELSEAEAAALTIEVEAPISLAEVAPPLAETPPPAPAATTLLRAEALEEDGEPAADELLLPGALIAANALPAAALTWSAVRVLRLGSYSLPQLAHLASRPLPAPTWLGPASVPAAPYLGTGLPVPEESLQGTLAAAIDSSRSAAAAEPLTSEVVAVVAPGLLVSELPTTAAPSNPTELLPQTAALETDLLPDESDALALVELASHDLATLEEEVAPPAQAGWPGALASLRQPAALPLAAAAGLTADPSARPAYPALQPAATHYPAADLNFQIIQYARFAVPVALTEPPFAVIYAPAWPTWLAAQELRQRTGRPLVLHLATLAAPEDESAETAAGWMAELQRQALHRADLVLTETAALAQRLHHELGLAAGTVRVVPAADAVAIAQALHEAQPRPAANPA